MDNDLNTKLAIVALSLFFLIWFLTSWSDSERCDASLERTREAYSTLYRIGAIQRVVIRNGEVPYDIAMDSVVIDQIDDLEAIRQLLNDRARFVWQRRTSLWELHINLLLKDGNRLQLKMEKYESDVIDNNSYRVYEDCDPAFESGATELATKIIDLIENCDRPSR
jgi:hypothetical protein